MHEQATSFIVGNVMTALQVVTRKRVHSEVGLSKRIGDSEILLACILYTLLIVVWRFLQMGNEDQLDNLPSSWRLRSGVAFLYIIDIFFLVAGRSSMSHGIGEAWRPPFRVA